MLECGKIGMKINVRIQLSPVDIEVGSLWAFEQEPSVT